MQIGFIGFRNMAPGLARNFAGTQAVEQIGSLRPRLRQTAPQYGAGQFRAFRDAAGTVRFADVVIVAVKPGRSDGRRPPESGAAQNRGVGGRRRDVRTTSGCWRPVRDTSRPCPMRRSPSAKDRRLRRQRYFRRRRGGPSSGCCRTSDWCYKGRYPGAGRRRTVCGRGPAFAAMFVEALADAAVAHGGIPRTGACRTGEPDDRRHGKTATGFGTHQGDEGRRLLAGRHDDPRRGRAGAPRIHAAR